MTIINPKSIAGVTSITTPSGSDNLFTVHTSDTTERFRIDNTGTTKIVTGIVTTLTATGSAKVGAGITLSPDGDAFFTGITTITANNVIGLNVENNTGSGAQTTIRSKSTAANASNFVRSESSDGLYIYILLLKYGTGHSAYGALSAGGGAVYANSSVPITIMSDGGSGYINFACCWWKYRKTSHRLKW